MSPQRRTAILPNARRVLPVNLLRRSLITAVLLVLNSDPAISAPPKQSDVQAFVVRVPPRLQVTDVKAQTSARSPAGIQILSTVNVAVQVATESQPTTSTAAPAIPSSPVRTLRFFRANQSRTLVPTAEEIETPSTTVITIVPVD
ncbi:MAG: hypothetical protein KDA89_18145 [Planctomycetaceae bacterium]|nr:hypothetical protein [Planctomycetaceae bacterium]